MLIWSSLDDASDSCTEASDSCTLEEDSDPCALEEQWDGQDDSTYVLQQSYHIVLMTLHFSRVVTLVGIHTC
jgi:hypothetical protein